MCIQYFEGQVAACSTVPVRVRGGGRGGEGEGWLRGRGGGGGGVAEGEEKKSVANLLYYRTRIAKMPSLLVECVHTNSMSCSSPPSPPSLGAR